MLFGRTGVVSAHRRLGRRWGLALVGCGVALAYACDSSTTRPTQPSIITNPTSPSGLSPTVKPAREVDDAAPGSTTGQETTGGCLPTTPECSVQPAPARVSGNFTVTAVDGSSISGPYSTATNAVGLPFSSSSMIGNLDTTLNGERRFAGVTNGIWSVKFASSTVQFDLKFNLTQPGNPRTYSDNGVFPYSAPISADSTCTSGQRVIVRFGGALENIGRFEAVLNHCVSVQ